MKHESRNKFNLIFVAAIMGWVLAGLPGGAFAQNINTPEHFPDPKFRAAVEKFMGVAPGGAFTAEQAAAKTGELNCGGMGITNSKGIEYFINLDTLSAGWNLFTSIDLSKNIGLVTIRLNDNLLKSLDVSKNINLGYLDIPRNKLISIDVSHNQKLIHFWVPHNDISKLDLSKNIKLEKLDISDNFFEHIDLSNNKVLVALNIRNNFFNCFEWEYLKTYKKLGTPVYYKGGNIERGFVYSPQKYGTFECDQNSNTSANFPDPNFRAAVERLMGVAPGGEFTGAQLAEKTGVFDASGLGIGNIQGIGFLNNVQVFNLSQNNILTLARLVEMNWPEGTIVDVSSNPLTYRRNLREILVLQKRWGQMFVYTPQNSSYPIPPLSSLVSPWKSQDIGNVGIEGLAGMNASNTFAVSGSGAGLGGSIDGFHYVHQPFTGDCEMTTRVTHVGTGSEGIMFRQSLEPDAPFVGVRATRANGILVQ